MSNNNFDENRIKGSIAEAIIERLFIQLGFNVFKFGMEHTIPSIMGEFENKDQNSLLIRQMPDFVINKNGRSHFIEVKFRSKGCFTGTDLLNKHPTYNFPDAIIVLVTKKHIKAISAKELLDGHEIKEGDFKYLGSRKEFETDKEKIIEFTKLVLKYLPQE